MCVSYFFFFILFSFGLVLSLFFLCLVRLMWPFWINPRLWKPLSNKWVNSYFFFQHWKSCSFNDDTQRKTRLMSCVAVVFPIMFWILCASLNMSVAGLSKHCQIFFRWWVCVCMCSLDAFKRNNVNFLSSYWTLNHGRTMSFFFSQPTIRYYHRFRSGRDENGMRFMFIFFGTFFFYWRRTNFLGCADTLFETTVSVVGCPIIIKNSFYHKLNIQRRRRRRNVFMKRTPIDWMQMYAKSLGFLFDSLLYEQLIKLAYNASGTQRVMEERIRVHNFSPRVSLGWKKGGIWA